MIKLASVIVFMKNGYSVNNRDIVVLCEYLNFKLLLLLEFL